MVRLFSLLAVATAVLVASVSPASASGPADGVIFFAAEVGCGVAVDSPDGAFAEFAGSSTFIGGGSLFDDRVGWICQGHVVDQPPIVAPTVLTGLDCLVDNPFYPAFGPRPGVLSSSGTAIFYQNGDFRLVCPPSARA
jgi:hypothetical protein